jgi:hypothetical protein
VAGDDAAHAEGDDGESFAGFNGGFDVALEAGGEGFESAASVAGAKFGDDALVALFFEVAFHDAEGRSCFEEAVDEDDFAHGRGGLRGFGARGQADAEADEGE